MRPHRGTTTSRRRAHRPLSAARPPARSRRRGGASVTERAARVDRRPAARPRSVEAFAFPTRGGRLLSKTRRIAGKLLWFPAVLTSVRVLKNACISGVKGAIAQLGERLDRTQEVAGSSPASSIRWKPCYGGASVVSGVGAGGCSGTAGTACGYRIGSQASLIRLTLPFSAPRDPPAPTSLRTADAPHNASPRRSSPCRGC